MSAHRPGSAAWHETHPDAPSARELALDELQAAIANAGSTSGTDDVVPCRTTLGPGELCSVCWTDHGKATS